MQARKSPIVSSERGFDEAYSNTRLLLMASASRITYQSSSRLPRQINYTRFIPKATRRLLCQSDALRVKPLFVAEHHIKNELCCCIRGPHRVLSVSLIEHGLLADEGNPSNALVIYHA